MTRVRISMLAAGTAALIALGATACGDITENGDPDKNGNGGDARNAAEVQDDPAALDGRTFVSTKVSTGDDKPAYLGSVEVELSFEKDARRLTGGVGCNGMFGELSATDGTLSLDGIGRTEMACEEPLMRQEEWLVRLLESDPSWELTKDDQLRISSDGTELLLEEQKTNASDDPAALRDVTWKLETVAEAGAGPDGTARHSAAMEKAELTFATTRDENRGGGDGGNSGNSGDDEPPSEQDGTEDGTEDGSKRPGQTGAEPVRVQGTGGCNGFGGRAVIMPNAGGADSQRSSEYDGTIDFGPLISTKKACNDDEVMRVEQQMMTTLDGKVPYTLDQDTLTLYGAEHELTFSGH